MMHHINPKTAFFLHRTDLITNNFLMSQWLMVISFPKFVKVDERAKDVFYRFEGAAPQCCCTLPPRKHFNT